MSGSLSRVVVTCRTTKIVLAKGGTSGGGGGVTSVTGTAPIASSEGTTPVISITPATDAAPGSMSAADKAKVDALDTAAYEPTSAFDTAGAAAAAQTAAQSYADGLASNYDAAGAAAGAVAGHESSYKHSNLPSDTEKTNIGNLDSAAYQPTTAFDASGAASGAVSSHESSYKHANLPTDSEKVNIGNLNGLAYQADAPSDDARYERENGTWQKAQSTLNIGLGTGDAPLVTGSFMQIPISKGLSSKTWRISASGLRTVEIDLWKKAGGNPTVANSMIGAGTKIALNNQSVASGTTDDWDEKDFLVDDYVIVNIINVDGVMSQCDFSLGGDSI